MLTQPVTPPFGTMRAPLLHITRAVCVGVFLCTASGLPERAIAGEVETATPIPVCTTPPTAAGKAKTPLRYVGASSAGLRDGPSTDARLRLQIPIGTRLEVSCGQDGWLHVWSPAYHGAVGWMRADLVQVEQPTLATLTRERGLAPDGAARRRIGERAVALAPLDEPAHALLIGALREVGDVTALARAEARLAALHDPHVAPRGDEPRLILVADGEMASPIAQVTNGKLVPYPVMSSDEEKDLKIVEDFSKRYFGPGRAYHFVGAGRRAVALIRAKEEPSCSSIVASIKHVPALDAAGAAGILSNFELPGEAPTVTRNADPREQRVVIALLRALLVKRKVDARDVGRILQMATATAEGLAITVVPGKSDKPPLLVATANVEFQPKPSRTPEQEYRGYNVVLVAAADANGRYSSVYQSFDLAEGEQSYGPQQFLAHATFILDGEDDLIFRGTGYEWWYYRVIGRRDGKWQQLVQGGGGGC